MPLEFNDAIDRSFFHAVLHDCIDSAAEGYYASDTHPQHVRIAAILEAVEESPILDMGCGTGVVSRELLKRGFQDILAVDVSQTALTIAEHRARAFVGVRWEHGWAEDIELPAGSFRTVICTEALEHVMDLDLAIATLDNALAVGGRIILSVPIEPGVSSVHLRVFGEETLSDVCPASWRWDDVRRIGLWQFRQGTKLA